MLTNRPRLLGTLVGITCTIVCASFFFIASKGDLIVELEAFDWRIRACNTLNPDSPIVHLDIDDGALDRIGRWPWPRADIADLIRATDELGALNIIMDLLFSEHEQPRYEDPARGRNSDVEPNVPIIGSVSKQNPVFGDLELADAVRSAGNVIMSVQLDVVGPDQPDSLRPRLSRQREALRDVTVDRVLKEYGLRDTPAMRDNVAKELLRLRVGAELRRAFTLTAGEVAALLGVSTTEVETVLAGVKRRVAEEAVDRLFATGSPPDLAEVLSSILGEDSDRRNADRQDVIDAFRSRLGLSAFRRTLDPLSSDVAMHIYRAGEVVPLYNPIAEAAADLAAVTFITDRDGGVRRVPIVIQYEGRAVAHLGLAAAARVLKLDLSGMSMLDPRTLVIPRGDVSSPLKLPLDGRGNLIIHWTRTAKDWRSGADFPHISAAKVWSLVDARRQIQLNETMINYLLADVVAASQGTVSVVSTDNQNSSPQVMHTDTPYRRMVNQQLELERRIHMARLHRDLAPEAMQKLRQESTGLLKQIRKAQDLAVSVVKMSAGELAEIPREEIENDPKLKSDAQRIGHAQELILEDIPNLQRANQSLASTVSKLKEQLSGLIKGRNVFIGYAATAQGDIVATPIDPTTNGVMCHAQVFNAILQNRCIFRPALWNDILVCLMLGGLAAVITSTIGPRLALFLILLLIAAYAAVNALVLFRLYDTWLCFAPIAITIFLTWAFVTLFRQFTAERDKRLFRKQLSQYTSPAIAAKIAESPEAARVFKQVQTRDMTCLFSDLAGFTSITEREDAEVVQYVLNTYFERMCQAIWACRGLISKFMGDGIMAFFNSSVDPLPEHPGAACETALDVFEALDDLKREQAHHPAGDVFQQLEMRVGIAAGLCKNGDMGSELKADYTVLGDVVNLAARLEPANKVFGTRIMVSGPVREAVKQDYEFRYLAELQVKGKSLTVPAYEVVCRKGELTDEQRSYIKGFEAGVELYKARRWDECIAHFSQLRVHKSDDKGAAYYIKTCQELKQFPPPDNWNGALELKEK
jgi:class 3 adenylate cyclase/CHASE2 domain-containing sensor protein